MTSQKLTKLSLRLFIASIVATALMGIVAISIPTDDWEFEIKVILTTLTIAAASVCGLACGGCLTRGHRVLPSCGLFLCGLAAILSIVGIWSPDWGSGTNWQFWEEYWKWTAIVACYAVACAHLSMLFMANLAGGYRWAYLVAYQLILGLATLIAAALIFEIEKESYWRVTGVIGILVAAITLLVPVFHRLSRDEVAAMKAEADPLFVVEEEIARVKKQLIELENKRRMLLGRTVEPGATITKSRDLSG